MQDCKSVSIGITDEASTINRRTGLRETQRTGLVRKIIGTSPSISPSPPSHTLNTSTASITAVAAHHSHLDTLYTLPSHSGGHVQWASTELASALFVTIYAMAARMVWYGTAAFQVYLVYLFANHDLPSLLVLNLSITTDQNVHVLTDTIPLSLPQTSPLSSTIYLC